MSVKKTRGSRDGEWRNKWKAKKNPVKTGWNGNVSFKMRWEEGLKERVETGEKRQSN